MSKKGHNRGPCRIEGCPNHVQYPNINLCGRCYHYIRRWSTRSPGEILARADQIGVWDILLNHLVPSNVTRANTGRLK